MARVGVPYEHGCVVVARVHIFNLRTLDTGSERSKMHRKRSTSKSGPSSPMKFIRKASFSIAGSSSERKEKKLKRTATDAELPVEPEEEETSDTSEAMAVTLERMRSLGFLSAPDDDAEASTDSEEKEMTPRSLVLTSDIKMIMAKYSIDGEEDDGSPSPFGTPTDVTASGKWRTGSLEKLQSMVEDVVMIENVRRRSKRRVEIV